MLENFGWSFEVYFWTLDAGKAESRGMRCRSCKTNVLNTAGIRVDARSVLFFGSVYTVSKWVHDRNKFFTDLESCG